jgi:hypothetical protein
MTLREYEHSACSHSAAGEVQIYHTHQNIKYTSHESFFFGCFLLAFTLAVLLVVE